MRRADRRRRRATGRCRPTRSPSSPSTSTRRADVQAPAARDALFDDDFQAAAGRFASGEERVSAAPGPSTSTTPWLEVCPAPRRCMLVSSSRKRVGGEVGERGDARSDLAERLGVEAGDDVGQVGRAGAALEAGLQAVADDGGGREHRPRRARSRRRTAATRPRRRLSPLIASRQSPAHPRRPSAISSTRSAAAATSCSWVTMTTARPCPVRPRSSPSRSAAAVLSRLPGRLVGEHQRRVVDERAGDREALLLAAGELVREVLGDRGDAQLLDQPRCARGTRRRARPAGASAAARSPPRSAPRPAGRTGRRSRCAAGAPA